MKSNQLLKLLLMATLVCTLSLHAQIQQQIQPQVNIQVNSGTKFKYGSIYYIILNDREVSVAQSYEYENLPITILEIPETVQYEGVTYTVTQIASYAFHSWNQTTKKVILPSTIQWIGECGFGGMFHLHEIECYATTPPLWETNNTGFRPFIHTDATVYVPFGCKTAYDNDFYWHIMTNIVEMPGDYYSITINSGGGVSATQKVISNNKYTYQLVPSQGKNLKALYFNGNDVTAEVIDGIYTTPAITQNSTLTVIFE